MATGGFRPNATTDFLEEWKAKREKMRAKMLGDIAAATGVSSGSAAPTSLTSSSNKSETRNSTPSSELNNNGSPDRGGPTPVNCGTSYSMARSSSSSALKRPEEDPHPTPAVRGADSPVGNLKKAPQPEKLPSTPQPESITAITGNNTEKDSPSPSKGKEKKSSGPSARKGKGQIEKRKLREKRRSTGVVSIPSSESLDELDDDDGGGGGAEQKKDEAITQLNTVQNETMTSSPEAASPDSPRFGSGRHKSSTGPGSEEEAGGTSRPRQGRHGRDASAAVHGGLEKRIEELEQELATLKEENDRLLKGHQDKDKLIVELTNEIELLNRDIDDIEDENEQLKEENKTLLKVVGQLTR